MFQSVIPVRFDFMLMMPYYTEKLKQEKTEFNYKWIYMHYKIGRRHGKWTLIHLLLWDLEGNGLVKWFQTLLAQGPLVPVSGSDYQQQIFLVNPNILLVTHMCMITIITIFLTKLIIYTPKKQWDGTNHLYVVGAWCNTCIYWNEGALGSCLSNVWCHSSHSSILFQCSLPLILISVNIPTELSIIIF